MGDEELIEWLRDLAAVLGKEAFRIAANRIEALTEKRDNAVADLEAKLAKAVEALERIAGVKGPYSHPFPESYEGYGAFAIVTSRETLEEIKGESHE